MDLAAINAAIAPTREGLQAANFGLDVVERNGRLVLAILVNGGACGDCLVPKSMFLRMVRDEIAEGGLSVKDIDVIYPVDLPTG